MVVTHKSGRRKTGCTQAVLSFFGVSPDQYHYAEDRTTVKRVLRRAGFSVRSRASKFGIGAYLSVSIGQLRKQMAKKCGDPRKRYYVGVVGHAMVLDGTGRTVCDTSPRKRDARKVTHISLVEI